MIAAQSLPPVPPPPARPEAPPEPPGPVPPSVPPEPAPPSVPAAPPVRSAARRGPGRAPRRVARRTARRVAATLAAATLTAATLAAATLAAATLMLPPEPLAVPAEPPWPVPPDEEPPSPDDPAEPSSLPKSVSLAPPQASASAEAARNEKSGLSRRKDNPQSLPAKPENRTKLALSWAKRTGSRHVPVPSPRPDHARSSPSLSRFRAFIRQLLRAAARDRRAPQSRRLGQVRIGKGETGRASREEARTGEAAGFHEGVDGKAARGPGPAERHRACAGSRSPPIKRAPRDQTARRPEASARSGSSPRRREVAAAGSRR